VRRKVGVWLASVGLVPAAEERAARESQAYVRGKVGTRVAGALASAARMTRERVGPCGSNRAESDLAVGHDENQGGSWCGLSVVGGLDRLLYTGDRRMESLASLSDDGYVWLVVENIIGTLTGLDKKFPPPYGRAAGILLINIALER
jgi:hypothetical protein